MIPVLYPIEGTYTQDEVDVSVIIPLYKSRKVIHEQVMRWTKDRLRTEIIYVDDQCPEKSTAAVFQSWNSRPDKKDFIVKVILPNGNRGFGMACNLGAYYALGKYLIFLNADTTTTPNWIEPIVEALKDENVGIIGNLQIKEGGQWHGTVDSAGSEWNWDYSNFIHLGRHQHEGELIEEPFHWNDAPKEIMKPDEREMVTGCCFGIRKALFDEVGGFDCRYRVGYWEDSELCMTVREKGYKILFEPKSVVFHKLSHSEQGGHNFHHSNKDIFDNKWVASGRIDKHVKQKRIVPQTKIASIIVQRKEAHGDVLMASGVCYPLKLKYPKAKIYFRTKCPEVLVNNPYIDDVIGMDENIQHQLLINLDLAYERRPFTNILQSYADEAGVKVTDCSVTIEPKDTEFPLPDNYVVFHAGITAWVGRNWNSEGFSEIARRLKEHGFEIVTVGGKGDHLMPGSIDLRAKTTIPELAYVMHDAQAFVGIDSFPMHVAQVMNLKGVAFFGSIKPETRIVNKNMVGVTANPLQVACLGCHHMKFAPATVTNKCKTGTLDCETQFTVEEMWEKVKSCLKI